MVTVLMSVRDTSPPLLGQALDSILAQTFRDFEFLILDDGSRSPETLEYLSSLRDARVRLCFEPHRGLTATLNLGLARARGELIARQDADDWSEPDRLARQAAFFAANPDAVLLGSAAWTHRQDGSRLWPIAFPESHSAILAAFERGNPFVHGAAMFRRDAALRAGGYRAELPCAQDYDFFWRLAESGTAANLREPLYHYRYSAGSVSAARAAEQARAIRAAQRLARDRRDGIAEDVAAALRESAAEGDSLEAALKQADHLMLAGDYGRAWSGYCTAIRLSPSSRRAWGKLCRLGLFRAAPPVRELCFR